MNTFGNEVTERLPQVVMHEQLK